MGTVPANLRGTYYVNGPARFERAGMRYKHWLDGDGMVYSARFTDSSVEFTHRFIRTPKLVEEEAAGKPIYRGFGTAFPGDKLRRGVMLEPPVNVSVYPFAGTLLALGEQTLPYELDPVTLETRGEYDFGGKLNSVSPFAAHAKFDPATGNMINFGISYAADKPTVTVYEFGPTGEMLRRRRHPMRFPHSNHDFGFTKNHIVFHFSPLLMDFGKFWQGESVRGAMTWEPERGSYLMIAPREAKEAAFEVPLPGGNCLHQINCFEEGGQLTVDVLSFDSPVYFEYEPVPDMFSTVTPCRPVRYVVDLATRTLVETRAMSYGLAPDFPSINPHLAGSGYDEFYMLGISQTGQAGPKFFDQLAHASWSKGGVHDVYQSEPGVYIGGEPVWVNGTVIVQRIDARVPKAELCLFDGANVAAGPMCVLPLKHMIHPGFHASWK